MEGIEIEESQSGLLFQKDFQDLRSRGIEVANRMAKLSIRYIRCKVNSELEFEGAIEKVKRRAWEAIEHVFDPYECTLRSLMKEIQGGGFRSQVAVGNYCRLASDTIRLNMMTSSIQANCLNQIPPYYTSYPEKHPAYKKI